MAYNGNNLSQTLSVLDGSYKEWLYRSTDNFTTVKAANFISDAYARGVRLGDKITIVEVAAPPVMTIALILTSTAAGACTMTQTGLVP